MFNLDWFSAVSTPHDGRADGDVFLFVISAHLGLGRPHHRTGTSTNKIIRPSANMWARRPQRFVPIKDRKY
jgi:hypothetical protein